MKPYVRFPALLAAAVLAAAPLAVSFYPVPAWAQSTPSTIPKEAPCAVCSVREGAGNEPVRATTTYEGKTYTFCQEACRDEFLKNPREFVSAQAPAQDAKPQPQKPKPGASAVPT